MKSENLIKCPNCGTAINVNEVLYNELAEKINNEFNLKLEERDKEYQNKLKEIQIEHEKLKLEREKIIKEKENISEQIENEVRLKLKKEKEEIEKKIREKIISEQEEEFLLLKKELEEKSQKVKELNLKNIEIERLKREIDGIREAVILEKEKELTEKLKEEKEKIRITIEEANLLKMKEKEKIIEDLKKQIDEAKRKAEQGSMQLQGEVQEIEIEKLLKSCFPLDEITEVKKGQRGADVLQIVKNENGIVCGKIYYESKRTKSFDNNWLKKLKEDNLEVNADVLVLVSEALPDEIDKMSNKDGIWICSFHELKPLSILLRYTLIRMQEVTIIQHGRESKMEMLYNYFTSQEFKGQFEAIIEGFKSLQDSYNDEKLKMQKVWKEREKQLEKILTNAVSFYGSLKGIAGSSVPNIKMLEE
jgi:hypothetical protein